jgi:hypothetical protein
VVALVQPVAFPTLSVMVMVQLLFSVLMVQVLVWSAGRSQLSKSLLPERVAVTVPLVGTSSGGEYVRVPQIGAVLSILLMGVE